MQKLNKIDILVPEREQFIHTDKTKTRRNLDNLQIHQSLRYN